MNRDLLYPLRRLHGGLHDYSEYQKTRNALRGSYAQKIKEYKKKCLPFVFLVMTPEHGNLGDHAIALSETRLLNELGISYIEVTGKQLSQLKQFKLLDLMNGYPILVNGGGNLGTIWMDIELLQRDIIQKNPRSEIVIFPNTFFYENSDHGKEELGKSIELYNAHKHLTIYAREKASYKAMNPIYRDVKLMPDMVLFLKPYIDGNRRQGCLLCLRSDREKTRTQEQEAEIRQQVARLFGNNVMDTDMFESSGISVENREAALKRKFSQFSNAELVVTDRLHGMIFCAITGTPCIVIDSKSPKVRGCYEWIKDLDYIRFASSPSQIENEYKQIPTAKHQYDNSHLINYYRSLMEDVKKYAQN